MTRFRFHRGGLDESMATVVHVATDAGLRAHVGKMGSGRVPCAGDLVVKPYGYDKRIDWDTHIVTMAGFGVVGFTDGPLVPSSDPELPMWELVDEVLADMRRNAAGNIERWDRFVAEHAADWTPYIHRDPPTP